MSILKNKSEVKIVLKDDFEIPVVSKDSISDSMLNCDYTRLERLIDKNFTLPLKTKEQSRFQIFFETKQIVTGTENIIQNLKINRENINRKTEKQQPMQRFDSSFEFMESNLIKKFKLSDNLSKNNKFSKSEGGSCCDVFDFDDAEDQYSPLRIPKEVLSIIGEENDKLKSNESQPMVYTNDYENILRDIDFENDLNHHMNKEQSSHLNSLSPQLTLSEKAEKMETYKKILSNRTVTSNKFKTLIIKSQTDENKLVSKDLMPKISLDQYMFSNGISTRQSKNSIFENMQEKQTASWTFDQLLIIIYNPQFQQGFFNELYLINENSLNELIIIIAKNLYILLTTQLGKSFFISFLVQINHLSNKKAFELVHRIDFISGSTTDTSKEIVDIIMQISKISMELKDLIYSHYNSINIWSLLVSNKYGKNIVEFFLKDYYSKEQSKHKLLFDYLDYNFIEFSKANYTTFVIQTYVQYNSTKSALKKIFDNIEILSSCRNGIFVIIAGIKGYKNEDLYLLINKIMSYSEFLCNDVYASTLMEFIFKTHTNYSCELFIKTKLNFLLGKTIT